jgi:hypothetical protein
MPILETLDDIFVDLTRFDRRLVSEQWLQSEMGTIDRLTQVYVTSLTVICLIGLNRRDPCGTCNVELGFTRRNSAVGWFLCSATWIHGKAVICRCSLAC